MNCISEIPVDDEARGGQAAAAAARGPRVSCVVPSRCSDERFAALLQRLTDALADAGQPWEMVVIASGQEHGDLPHLQAWFDTPGVRLTLSKRPMSREQMLQIGLREARGDAVLVADGAGEAKLTALPEMVRQWNDGAPLVFAQPPAADGGAGAVRLDDAGEALAQALFAPGGALEGDLFLIDREVVQHLLR